jgi:hypothetical protein
MSLSVEHPTILSVGTCNLPLGVLIRVDQIRVLEHFGEEKGFLEVGEATTVGSVDVGNGAVAAADTGRFDDGLEAGEGPLRKRCQYLLLYFSGNFTGSGMRTYVSVLAVPSSAVGVVK